MKENKIEKWLIQQLILVKSLKNNDLLDTNLRTISITIIRQLNTIIENDVDVQELTRDLKTFYFDKKYNRL